MRSPLPSPAFRSRPLARRAPLLAGLCLLLAGAGCSSEESTGDADAGTATAARGMVYWPQLVNFDDLALRAEGLARSGDTDAVNAMHAKLVETGRAVTAESIPSNAKDRPQVETLLGDLTNLVDSIADDPASAPSLVLGLHSVTARIMAAAGMPHIHANSGPNRGDLHPVFGADGSQVGTAEVRLDSETGNIQVWLTEGGRGGGPWALPVATTMELTLPLMDRSVTLAAPASAEGDETTTFVFPGETDADASWLTGADFTAAAELRFADATTASFVLRPDEPQG